MYLIMYADTQEEYVEYSRHGTVLKGQEKAKIKSRYEEDVYINNHTVGNSMNKLPLVSKPHYLG